MDKGEKNTRDIRQDTASTAKSTPPPLPLTPTLPLPPSKVYIISTRDGLSASTLGAWPLSYTIVPTSSVLSFVPSIISSHLPSAAEHFDRARGIAPPIRSRWAPSLHLAICCCCSTCWDSCREGVTWSACERTWKVFKTLKEARLCGLQRRIFA